MVGREKNCKWHFEKHTGKAEGPSDAMMQNFKENPYNSLVRESIQNSLDAVNNENEPVKMVFSFKSINNFDFPSFFDLRKHIQGCIDHFPTNEKAKVLYGGMLKNFPDERGNHTIDYIRVSDYNTKGMWYKDDRTTDSPFFAFVRAAGVSAKEESFSGGAYGFGKTAYYQISPISTIIVSSRTTDGRLAFEGAASLCTHIIDGEILTSVGYYDNNNGFPVRDEDMIPAPFKRTEPGSDINIMGFKVEDKEEAKSAIILATLRNFWLTILRRKLEVVVEGVEINENTLPDLMETYFSEKEDKTRKAGLMNPRPYYEAVAHADEDANHKRFAGFIPYIGNVELYTFKVKDAADKVAYYRRPLMLVYGKRTSTSYGVYGAFVCEDKIGNEVLKHLEDPSHSLWKASNWRDENNKQVQRGTEVLSGISEFVEKSLASLMGDSSGAEEAITGLEDYLYIPQELMPEVDSADEGNNAFTGAITGEYLDEGGSITTDVSSASPVQNMENTDIGTVRVMQKGSINPVTTPGDDSDEMDDVGIHHRGPKKKKKRGKGYSPGDYIEHVPVKKSQDGSYRAFVPVRFKCAAQKEGGLYVYYLFIYSDVDVQDGEIELVVAGEQSDDKLDLAYSDTGSVEHNLVKGVRLSAGVRNTVKVRFVNNMEYAIKLSVYENR